jgi:hypothetical protein
MWKVEGKKHLSQLALDRIIEQKTILAGKGGLLVGTEDSELRAMEKTGPWPNRRKRGVEEEKENKMILEWQ